jgi:hypothetical protein
MSSPKAQAQNPSQGQGDGRPGKALADHELAPVSKVTKIDREAEIRRVFKQVDYAFGESNSTETNGSRSE